MYHNTIFILRVEDGTKQINISEPGDKMTVILTALFTIFSVELGVQNLAHSSIHFVTLGRMHLFGTNFDNDLGFLVCEYCVINEKQLQ